MLEFASCERNPSNLASVPSLSNMISNMQFTSFINPSALPLQRATRPYICRRPLLFHRVLQQSQKWARRSKGRVLNATALTSQSIDSGSYLHVLSGSKLRLTRALRPDGKRNWMVQDASGAEFSVPSKQVLFVVGPPSSYNFV